jgi:hypothetical protein
MDIKLMDRYERRRQRLRLLIDEQCEGKISECARRLGKPQSYVGRLLYPLGKKGKRNIGDGLISALEDTFNLPPGWLDGVETDAALADICKRWGQLPTYKQLCIASLFDAIANAEPVHFGELSEPPGSDKHDDSPAKEKKHDDMVGQSANVSPFPERYTLRKTPLLLMSDGHWRDYYGNFERENRQRSVPVPVDLRNRALTRA